MEQVPQSGESELCVSEDKTHALLKQGYIVSTVPNTDVICVFLYS